MTFFTKAAEIRNQLRKFSPDSVAFHVAHHLSENNKNKNKKIHHDFPWISALIFEWSLQAKHRKRTKAISRNQFLTIYNRTWNLQNFANKMAKKDILLTLRRAVIQQLNYQEDDASHLSSIRRHFTIMNNDRFKCFFDSHLKSTTSLNIDELFIFLTSIYNYLLNGNTTLNYSDLVLAFSENIGVDNISKSIIHLGNNLEELRRNSKKNYKRSITTKYYFEKPLVFDKPLIFLNNKILSLHPYTSQKRLSEIAHEILLKSDKSGSLRRSYNKAFEQYVGKVLKNTFENIIEEKEIVEYYKERKIESKCVDFVIENEESPVFIDAKCISPHLQLMVSDSRDVILGKLETTLKAISQIDECSKNWKPKGYASKEKYSGLIVTNKSLYFSNVQSALSMLHYDFHLDKKYYNTTSTPIHRIYLISVEDLEKLCATCNTAKLSLNDFIDFCSERDKDISSSCIDTKQHVSAFSEKFLSPDQDIDYKLEGAEEFQDLITEMAFKMKASSRYWRNGTNNFPTMKSHVETIKSQLNIISEQN